MKVSIDFNKTLIALLFFLTITSTYSQVLKEKSTWNLDEVVVSDSRFLLKRSHSGRAIVKITAKDIENSPYTNIQDILNRNSGIEINGSRSNAGQNLGYFVRGGSTGSVQIIIDGVLATNPGNFSPSYDLRFLSPENIESIEVLKGASAALYGSGASAAIINITTKQPSNKPISGHAATVLGTDQAFDHQDYKVATTQSYASVNGNLGRFGYSTGANYQYTDGLSAAIAPKTNESDAFSKYNAYAKLGYKTPRLNTSATANVNRFKNNYDEGSYLDNTTNHGDNTQYRIGTSTEYTHKSGSVNLNAAYDDYNIRSFSPSKIERASRTLGADLYSKYTIVDKVYAIVGLNYQYMGSEVEKKDDPKAKELQKTQQLAPYTNVVYVSKSGLNLNAGARYNMHSTYGGGAVYQVNPSYSINLREATFLKFYLSYGTSFVAPGVVQLFDPIYGNRSLEPELSQSYEGGASLAFSMGRFSATYFSRDTQNRIGYDSNYKTINLKGQTHAEGLELEWKYSPFAKLQITGNYTKTYTDKRVLRIPINKVNAELRYAFLPNFEARVFYQYVDVRTDTFFDASSSKSTPVILKPYTLVDVSISHLFFRKRTRAGLAVHNVFNQEFMEVYGYSTRGRNVLLSLQYQF